MMKRISAIAMAFIIVAAMIPAAVPVAADDTSSAAAATQDQTKEVTYKFTYKPIIVDEVTTYEVTKYDGNESSITIPSTIDGIKVTSIGTEAFAGNTTIKKVVIPDTVTSIGQKAFYGCSNLTEITIPDSVQSIGLQAFREASSLTSIKIPEGINTITARMFYKCSGLTEVTIPKSVTTIADYAFYGCKNLKKVNYAGSSSDWKKITISDTGNDKITGVAAPTMSYADSGKNSSTNTTNTSTTNTSTTNTSTTNTNTTNTNTSDTSTTNSANTPTTQTNTTTNTNTNTTTTTTPAAAISIKNCTISVASSMTYTGSALTPEPTVKYGSTVLIKDIDYTLSYINNTDVGTAAVTVTGKDDYTDKASKAFTITAASIANAVITVDSAEQVYSGDTKQPAIKSIDLGGTMLDASKDYKVTYANNINVGTGSVTVTGTGNYTGTVTKTFEIHAMTVVNAAAALETRTFTYDGKVKEPKFSVVKLGGIELKENTDYTVSYINNIEAGTGTATLTGKGNYTGTIKRIFVIQRSLSGANITLEKTTCAYSGKTKKPAVESVTLDGTALVEGTDYTVSYKNNKNIGTAKVVITGKGCYYDRAETTFNIAPKSGATFTKGAGRYKVTGADSVAFIGLNKASAKTLTVPDTVTYGGKEFYVTKISSKALMKTNITKLIIGNNVTEIGASVCLNCPNLKSVRVGDSVISIGNKAFKGCSKLATINIKSTVLTEVGDDVFLGIKSTARIIVPSDLYDEYEEILSDKGQEDEVSIE